LLLARALIPDVYMHGSRVTVTGLLRYSISIVHKLSCPLIGLCELIS